MGTNYFVIGYDHPDAEPPPDPDPDDIWLRIRSIVYEAWVIGFGDGQRVATNRDNKCGLSDSDQILIQAKAVAFPPKRLHIGKSSLGWCFALATHKGIQSLADWERVWTSPGVHIEDEYGRRYVPEMMRFQITQRSWKGNLERNPEERAEWLRLNQAVEGPNGLARHTYQARIPDEGPSATYDLCEGRFR